MVDEAGGLVDLERLRRVLDGYQEEQFLQIGELWALPALLRLTLLEDLGGFAAVVAGLPNAASSLAPEELETQIGNRIRSLQQLDTTNWRGFVESVSAVERVLRTDPGGVYGRMDFETRDGYRKAVEELADWSGLSEPEVARAALRLAASAPPREPRKGHLGAWLIDRAARRQLEHELGCRVPLGRRIRRGLGRWALVWYLGAIGTVVNLQPGFETTTLESKTNFFAPAVIGSIVLAESLPLHRGRRTMVWQTRLTNSEGRLLAMITQTQMVLEKRT